jgi:hypothetical protein
MTDLTQTMVSGILGLGWLTTLTAWARDRTAAKQKIMDFLMERRLDLDGRPELLMIVGLLKQEREARQENLSLPTIPEALSGEKLRNLPGFLESIGTFLEYNPAMDVACFADQVHEGPMFFTLLHMIQGERDGFMSSQSARQQQGNKFRAARHPL